MATFDHISGAEPSTVTFKAATVAMTRNSSKMHQEIISLGDPDTSNAIAAVLNAIPASTAWGVVVRQVGNSSIQGNSTVFQGTSPWVIAGNSTVAPLAGSTWATRPVQSSQADLRMTAYQSTAADFQAAVTQASTVWQVQVGGYSTIVAVSSLGGAVIVRSSAANALHTAYQSTASDLNVRVQDVQTSSGASVMDSTNTAVRVNVVAGSAAGSTVVSVSQLLDSSGGSITAGDSANNALRVNVVAGAASGSTIVTVSTVLGAVIVRSSAANFLNTVYQSSAAELQATVTPASTVWAVQLSQYSTVVAVSSLGGAVIVRSSAANALVSAYQSTAADLLVTASQGGAWSVSNISPISSVAPSSGSSGLVVRPVVDAILTIASTNAMAASTAFSIQSSVANIRSYVTAYTITSTVQAQTGLKFYSSGTLLWPVVLAALSSAVAGVNLAVSAPAYLFRTNANEALSLRTASTITGFRVGISYFQAP